MRKIVMIMIWLFAGYSVFCQSTVTIGTGTGTQKQPFGMWASYERSASLYLQSEIGSLGTYGMMINSLAWNVGTGDPTTCPTRIFVKSTTSSNLTATTWSSMISNATLVYDASVNFTSAGWRQFDIADFAYTSGNLLILCETNYGGSGAVSYPIFKYSYFPGKHQFWQEYDLPPAGNGTVNENRPNIQISYTYIPTSIVPPSGFLAIPYSSSQVNLSWKRNAANDAVMIAFNQVNTFGTPVGGYVAGDVIPGGGTVIYNGSGITFSQTSGLDPGITYYYKAWSVHPPVPGYSSPTGSQATTLCETVSQFPDTTDFEVMAFPPACWSIAGMPWLRSGAASGNGSGAASAYADFFNTISGDFELISPDLDFGTLSSASVSFDHAYATFSGQVDKLELWYSDDHGANYLLLTTWLGGLNGPLNTGGATSVSFIPTAGQWASKNCLLPAGTNKVKFKGVSGYGNNLFLDNIMFYGDCPVPTGLTATNITISGAELNWTPAGQATQWEISWGFSGYNPVTEGSVVSGITGYPYFLEGLDQGGAYEFYVRSDCGGSVSDWAGPAGFNTLCTTLEIPYSEFFDNYITPATGCYVVADDNSDGYKWATSAIQPESAPNAMYISNNSAVAMNDWFFTPGLNLAGGVEYALNFAYRKEGSGLPDQLELKCGTGQAAAEMIPVILWYDSDIQSDTYITGSAAFTPAVNGIYFFGWHGHSPAGSGGIMVDNVTVDVANILWTGAVSGEWEDPGNWSPSMVPNGFQDVVVSSGALNYPVIYYPGAACRNLMIEAGTGLTLEPGSEVNINGNLTIQATGILNNQGTLFLRGNLDNQNPD